jgi:hypothetical protein
LYERYTVDFAIEAFTGRDTSTAPVLVEGEHRYRVGKSHRVTSDVALLCGATDLILVEVGSSHLTTKTLIERDAEKLQSDLAKTLTEKIGQLYDRIDDLWAGHATIADWSMEPVTRVWPIVVHADSIFHSKMLWNHIERSLRGRHIDQRSQPLTLLEMPEYERFLGLCQTYWPIELLEGKTSARWGQRDFDSWANDAGFGERTGIEIIDRYWQRVMRAVADELWPGIDHEAEFARRRVEKSASESG